MSKEDYKHAGELGDLRDTKYWFKRDINTFKKAFRRTTKISPILIVVSLGISLIIYYPYDSLHLIPILTLGFVLFPVVALGYILLYVIVKKGYNIYAHGGGTVIDGSRNQESKARNKTTKSPLQE